jgi:hypothetical protein
MSEEILKALMQLFALIAKQDGGVEDKERKFVHDFLVQQIAEAKVREYYSLFEEYAGLSSEITDLTRDDEIKLTSVVDSVKILGFVKKSIKL